METIYCYKLTEYGLRDYKLLEEKMNEDIKRFDECVFLIDWSFHSYNDNLEDERVEEFDKIEKHLDYCEIDLAKYKEQLLYKEDELIGFVFFVKKDSTHKEEKMIIFNSEKNRVFFGYSASHSGESITINSVKAINKKDVPIGTSVKKLEELSSNETNPRLSII